MGLLGGSFNPAHEGHRHISLVALSRLALDEVWWLVSPQNPLKSRRDMVSFGRRFAMARLQPDPPTITAAPTSAAGGPVSGTSDGTT